MSISSVAASAKRALNNFTKAKTGEIVAVSIEKTSTRISGETTEYTTHHLGRVLRVQDGKVTRVQLIDYDGPTFIDFARMYVHVIQDSTMQSAAKRLAGMGKQYWRTLDDLRDAIRFSAKMLAA